MLVCKVFDFQGFGLEIRIFGW